jgi:hypothetical protein
LGGVFFPLASLAKQLRSPTMRLFYRLASRKNTLAEIDNLSFTRSLISWERKSGQKWVVNKRRQVCIDFCQHQEEKRKQVF